MQGSNSGWSRWRRFDSVQNVNFVSGTNPGLPRTTVPASLPIRPFFCMLPSFPPADFGSKPQFPLCSDALGGYRSIDCVWRVWSCSSATGVLSIFFSPQHQCNVIPLTTTLQRISVDVYTDTETCVQCVQLTGSVLGVFLIPSPASLSPQRLCCVSCFVTAKPLIYAFMQLS